MINVTVSTSPAGLDSTCAESMEYGGDTQGYRFHCSPPARGSYVTVTLTGDNVTLVLCQVFVKTIGKLHKLPLNSYLASNPSNFFNFFFFFFCQVNSILLKSFLLCKNVTCVFYVTGNARVFFSGVGGRGREASYDVSSAVPFVLFLYLLNISYYIFCVSLDH